MAVKRKPLSASTIKTLKAKAKKSKLFNLADLKASFSVIFLKIDTLSFSE